MRFQSDKWHFKVINDISKWDFSQKWYLKVRNEISRWEMTFLNAHLPHMQQNRTNNNQPLRVMKVWLHHFITLPSGQTTNISNKWQMKTTNNNQPLSGDQYDHISSMLYLGQCYTCRPKCNLTQFVLIYIQQSTTEWHQYE